MEKITISKSQYESLKNSERKLQALENFGVDNWQGYEDAMCYLEEEEEEEEFIEDISKIKNFIETKRG